jgi:cytochrome c oxidase accessory protein FixG
VNAPISPDGTHLFEARRKVFPKAVRGPFRRFKWLVMVATLAVYYITPWLRWDRGPYAPNQAVLVDLANRRFYMFAIEIWPHEFYYVCGLLVMAAIGLFLVTSTVGRAWCGYACPQTVWTDLFQHVERWIDGDRNAQKRLANAPWTVGKLARRAVKQAVWLAIGVVTGGAWIFYFADAPSLAHGLAEGRAPLIAYSTIAVLTATTYLLGGFMREQVCQFMCPWPRIQAAMMDERSLTVTYRFWRGEPRARGVKRTRAAGGPELRVGTATCTVALADAVERPDAPLGDCVDCNACVAVCPTGIDIRDGAQIGCITCGLCIDACDEVMLRLGRTPKLIGYTTELDARAEQAGQPSKPPMAQMLRGRTVLYFALWCAVGAAMLFALGARPHLGISVSQARNPIWVRLSDGMIRNTYQIKVRNMQSRSRTVAIELHGLPGRMWTERGDRATATRTIRLVVGPDRVAKVTVFVAAPAGREPRQRITFTAIALDPPREQQSDESAFESPEN